MDFIYYTSFLKGNIMINEIMSYVVALVIIGFAAYVAVGYFLKRKPPY